MKKDKEIKKEGTRLIHHLLSAVGKMTKKDKYPDIHIKYQDDNGVRIEAVDGRSLIRVEYEDRNIKYYPELLEKIEKGTETEASIPADLFVEQLDKVKEMAKTHNILENVVIALNKDGATIGYIDASHQLIEKDEIKYEKREFPDIDEAFPKYYSTVKVKFDAKVLKKVLDVILELDGNNEISERNPISIELFHTKNDPLLIKAQLINPKMKITALVMTTECHWY